MIKSDCIKSFFQINEFFKSKYKKIINYYIIKKIIYSKYKP